MPVTRPASRLAASPVAAFTLAVVFVLGGLVAPGLHRAQHAAEWAAERAAHAEHHAGESHETADVPCAPAARELDCALCTGLSAFAAPAIAAPFSAVRPLAHASAETFALGAEAIVDARPRAPPVS